ncbi:MULTISPECIES: GIY-YIG nuclease family protein [unclassified Sphingomonas]|uniref:GIY-YIG nuclease family protein n=2 Tax=Sphingomonas TaxID=13687 RepID=UPI000B1A88BA|nr:MULTISPECIES: GIY-YIG nuclease family protein [unclassified Sphingomonas]
MGRVAMHENFQSCVYMLASGKCGTLYIGVTSDLVKRLHQHRTNALPGFTARYSVHHLVWYELHATMEQAILGEKRLKRWNRDWKLNLVERSNPEWVDLALGLGFEPVATRLPMTGS